MASLIQFLPRFRDFRSLSAGIIKALNEHEMSSGSGNPFNTLSFCLKMQCLLWRARTVKSKITQTMFLNKQFQEFGQFRKGQITSSPNSECQNSHFCYFLCSIPLWQWLDSSCYCLISSLFFFNSREKAIFYFKTVLAQLQTCVACFHCSFIYLKVKN